jgi:lysophospholipase L1-like esterase
LRRMNCFAAFVALFALAPQPTSATEPFELLDGDRVVFVGNTFIEREQRYGYLESALTCRWPERNIIFRNLGWSGDTVWGEARAGFDTPREGYQRLVAQTLALKPTVLFIDYGTNESFAGTAGLARFNEQLNRLLDDLQPSKARLVLLAPPMFEKERWPGGNLAERKADLELYTHAISQIAEKRRLRFVPEFCQAGTHARPLTDDGMHLTEYGYQVAAGKFMARLSIGVRDGISPEQARELRQAIVAKNRLFFHRYRPQNDTYLFGFRKHEQGNNAVEIPQFDPLIAKLEAKIAKLRVPVAHKDEPVSGSGASK